MARYFDFSYLIKKYMTEFTAIIPTEDVKNSAGFYENVGKKQVTMHGAIVNMRESRIYNSNGVYTAKDKNLYMLEPLENSMKNAKIIHNGNVYTVDSERENAEFTGVCAYVLKFVSVFKDGAT